LLDPYTDTAISGPGLLDPYAVPLETERRSAPQATPVSPPQPTEIDAVPELPSTASMERRTIRRAELDRRITDFDGLLASVQVAPARGGGFALVRLQPRSWLASLGLRQGDVVRSVAGEQVSTVEDAARVYARIRTLPSFLVEIDRSAQRIVLHVDIVR
jgi:hypothetical protein